MWMLKVCHEFTKKEHAFTVEYRDITLCGWPVADPTDLMKTMTDIFLTHSWHKFINFIDVR